MRHPSSPTSDIAPSSPYSGLSIHLAHLNGATSTAPKDDPTTTSLVPYKENPHGFSLSSNGNGVTSNGNGSTSFAQRSVARVNPPGTMMYHDSGIQRSELVRLVLQSLRDIGYTQSAAVLEQESGYQFETDLVAGFRESVLEGRWNAVESVLVDMGVRGDDDMRMSHFLIRQQKYLECLETRRADTALQILRTELAPLSFDSDRLHLLSSLMMCTSIDELKRRAQWSGATGGSREHLLKELQRCISPAIMMPPRRIETLLTQAQELQRRNCLFHNSRSPFSLYVDHECGRSLFPGITTNVLAEHEDEVWNVEWSPDGKYIASGGKDKIVIIWSVGPSAGSMGRTCQVEKVLRDHNAEIGALAWSWDSSCLLSSADKTVKMWNVKNGICTREIKDHSQLVSSAKWLRDNSGFLTGAMDGNIFFYNNSGDRVQSLSLTRTGLRVVDFALTPDGRSLVAVGQPDERGRSSSLSSMPPAEPFDLPLGMYSALNDDLRAKRTQLVIFDLRDGSRRSSQVRVGDMTSVKITPDSKYALINYAPNVVFLWEIDTCQLIRRFLGHEHVANVIRSCFGGTDGTWIVSGSEDRMIHVWHRDSGDTLEVLSGHKAGTVNAVAWNPVDDSVFASCSDDGTVRVWEAPTWTTPASDDTSIWVPHHTSVINGMPI